MQSLDKHEQGGLAMLEMAGCIVVLAWVAFIAFGMMDFCSKTFALRRITEKVLAKHSGSIMTAQLDPDGELFVTVDDARAHHELADELVEARGELFREFTEAGGDGDFRVEAELRVAQIDTLTGRFLGFTAKKYEVQTGTLEPPPEVRTRNSFDELFQRLVGDPGDASPLAEPTPDRGYAASQWNYLPVAAISAMRIFAKINRAPFAYLTLTSEANAYLADGKSAVVRGALR